MTNAISSDEFRVYQLLSAAWVQKWPKNGINILSNNTILTTLLITNRKGTLEVVGKGNAKRTVPLNKDVRKAIARYIEVRRNDGSDYLFIGQRGALKRNAINLILQKYGNRVNSFYRDR